MGRVTAVYNIVRDGNRVIAKTVKRKIHFRDASFDPADEFGKFAEAILVVVTSSYSSEWQYGVVQYETNMSRLRGGRARQDLSDQVGSEGCNAADDPIVVMRNVIGGERSAGSEFRYVHGSKDSSHNLRIEGLDIITVLSSHTCRVMIYIHKDRLRQREQRWIADNGIIAGRDLRTRDRSLRQAGDEFLDITNAKCSCCRVSWTVAIPECEV